MSVGLPGIDAMITLAHTADLSADVLAQARALMFEVFRGEATEEDWDHALGGLHALVHVGVELVGHGSVVQRQLLHAGRPLRCGYVEVVVVRPEVQRRGIGGLIMESLERTILRAYDVGALGASEQGSKLYSARGWQQWRGRCSVLSPSGIVPTPDDEGSVFVLPAKVPLDLDGELTCDWRSGDVW